MNSTLFIVNSTNVFFIVNVFVLNANNIILYTNNIVMYIVKCKQYIVIYCMIYCDLTITYLCVGASGPHRPAAPPHRAGGGPARAGGPPRAARTAGRRVLPSWHRPSGDEGGRYWPSSDSDEGGPPGGPVMRVGPRPGAKRGEEAAHAGKIHWHS